ncbi:MAG: spore coat associated protein CotJA [Clostridiales bacterium]|nr:spore coat associated protein CotJA [Clostridiales bacterium]
MYSMHPLKEPVSYTKEVLDSACCVPKMELAQAYVCPQKLEGIFPPEEGLRMGTIFPGLSQPYAGRYRR